MKQLIAALLVLVLAFPLAASAEVDLSSYSYDELRQLYDQTLREMISRPEWKEFKVPKGMWVVGVDIPAGSYSIRSTNSSNYINVFLWGAEAQDYVTAGGLIINESLYQDEDLIGKIILKEGNVLEISSTVILGPVRGFGM